MKAKNAAKAGVCTCGITLSAFESAMLGMCASCKAERVIERYRSARMARCELETIRPQRNEFSEVCYG